MIDTDRVAVIYVCGSFRINRVVYARMHVGKRVVEAHRVCESHDERRELGAARLIVVTSIQSESTVHRMRAAVPYEARNERDVVTAKNPPL